jgi:AraC family transcriptional regulator, carnitine catabolism transcriptional activator
MWLSVQGCASTVRSGDWRRLLKNVIMMSLFIRSAYWQRSVPLRKVAFLICPEFSNLGLAAATEPLFIANWLAQVPRFEWTVISGDGQPVRASNGRITAVDGGLELAVACQSVFVLSSFDTQQAALDRRVVGWLKRLAPFGVELVGIENGSLLLAEAGLLNGQRVAVHWDNVIGFRERYPATNPVAEPYARAGNGKLASCAGAAAVLELMIAWMGWSGAADLADEVAEHLLLGRSRPDAAARPAELADPVIARAHALMAEHIDEPLPCRELARRAGISLRQLERRFRVALRSSVLQQYRLVRIGKAHQLLQQTTLSVTEVALSCGFSSPEYFCRLYRSMLGCSPSADRRQSTTAPVLRRGASKDRPTS